MLQAAIDKLERALELLPEDSDAWYSLGVLLSDQGRKEEAVAAYTRSVAINAGPRVRSVLAAPRQAPLAPLAPLAALAALAPSVAWSASQLAAHAFGPGLIHTLAGSIIGWWSVNSRRLKLLSACASVASVPRPSAGLP